MIVDDKSLIYEREKNLLIDVIKKSLKNDTNALRRRLAEQATNKKKVDRVNKATPKLRVTRPRLLAPSYSSLQGQKPFKAFTGYPSFTNRVAYPGSSSRE